MTLGGFSSLSSRLSQAGQHVYGLRTDLRSRVSHFRRHRSLPDQRALEDFSHLLTAWGISSEADIPGVIRDLRLRCLVLAVPVFVAFIAALLMPGLYALLTLLFVAPPCLFGLLVTRWRMSILQHRAFMPPHRWLFARFITTNTQNTQRSAL